MGWIKDLFSGGVSPKRWSGDGDDIPADDSPSWGWTFLGTKTASGIRVTPDIALKASAVYACVKVLAETMASLPLQVYRKLPDGGLEPAPNHPVAELIRYQPNHIQTAVEFWETLILHAAMRGVGYAQIVPGARGAVDQLISLHTDRVVTEYMRDGTLRFRVTNPHTGVQRVLLQEEVFRVPGLSSDGVNGLRAVDLAADAIGIGMAADQYAARVFSNNLNMGGFLTSTKKMSVDATKRLIARLMEKYASPENAHRPAVLQDGLKFEPASMKASEAQLLEARKWQISEIARFWRIPLHMLGVDDQTNRSTVEEQSINFVKYTIRPWARRIEQAIRRDLITATGLFEAKFNLDALERGNLAARKDYWSAALGNGGAQPWMAVNEVRIAEGLNPINESWAWQVQRSIMTQPALAAPAGDAAADDTAAIEAPKTVAIEDNTPDAIARRVAGKENAAFRKATTRFAADPDGMREWTKAFYGGHVSYVMENLNIAKDDAKAYCAVQRDEALAANDIVALIERREERLAGQIAAVLKAHGASNG